jgi:hypothetical protein
VVSFTTRPLYSQGKSSWYPLDRRLGGPQSRSGRGGEENSKFGLSLRGAQMMTTMKYKATIVRVISAMAEFMSERFAVAAVSRNILMWTV